MLQRTLEALANSIKVPDIRKKILFTLALTLVFRIGSYIPTPGVDSRALAEFFERIASRGGGTLFGIMDMFSGGAISKLTIFALGIMPYISSSIIMQLLTAVIPYLERLAKEGGQEGRRKIIQYTRYGTVVLGIIQSFFIALWLENPAHFDGVRMVQLSGWPFRLLTILTLTSGTAFIMWLGEKITEHGVGNGSSFLITAGIISRIPTAAHQLFLLLSPFSPSRRQIDPLLLIPLSAMLVAVIIFVIVITQGQRKIPVQYAKRIVGRRVYGGQSTYLPLRVSHANVIPIIFAQSIILFPATIAGIVPNKLIQGFAGWLSRGQLFYILLYTGLIVFFSFFYTAITFNPIDISDNLKKYGGFIPGIRPGKPTSEHLDFIMTRVTLAGAIFLSAIAIFPDLIGKWLNIPYLVASFFGGTGLLIIVGVMLDTMRQIESQLEMRHYSGFMIRGRLQGRR